MNIKIQKITTWTFAKLLALKQSKEEWSKGFISQKNIYILLNVSCLLEFIEMGIYIYIYIYIYSEENIFSFKLKIKT